PGASVSVKHDHPALDRRGLVPRAQEVDARRNVPASSVTTIPDDLLVARARGAVEQYTHLASGDVEHAHVHLRRSPGREVEAGSAAKRVRAGDAQRERRGA